MDPSTALLDAHNAIVHRDIPAASAALLSYYQWRAKGGAQPADGDKYAERLSAQLLDLIDTLLFPHAFESQHKVRS